MAHTTTLKPEAGVIVAYYDWFENAQAGDILVYHTGDLAYDRDSLNASTQSDHKRADHLDVLAKRVLKDAEDGFLAITQKKVGTSIYEYRARRRDVQIKVKAGRSKVDADAVHA